MYCNFKRSIQRRSKMEPLFLCLIDLNEWCFTPLSTVFESYHGDSSHYSCLSWVSPVLVWGSEVSYPRALPRKTRWIRCGSNPGPLDYESNTLPLSHAGPPFLCSLILIHTVYINSLMEPWLSGTKVYYCIKPTLPVRFKHILTGGNRALTGENVY